MEQFYESFGMWSSNPATQEFTYNVFVSGFVFTDHHQYSIFGTWRQQRINSTLLHSASGSVCIPELNNLTFSFSTGSGQINQKAVNKVHNRISIDRFVGSLVSPAAFPLNPELCISLYYSRISRDGHQNYFGLAECD